METEPRRKQLLWYKDKLILSIDKNCLEQCAWNIRNIITWENSSYWNEEKRIDWLLWFRHLMDYLFWMSYADGEFNDWIRFVVFGSTNWDHFDVKKELGNLDCLIVNYEYQMHHSSTIDKYVVVESRIGIMIVNTCMLCSNYDNPHG